MNTPLTYEIVKEEEGKILSVKRVRDNRIYAIGDQTPYGKIIKFQIEKNNVVVSHGGPSLYGIQELRYTALQYLDFL